MKQVYVYTFEQMEAERARYHALQRQFFRLCCELARTELPAAERLLKQLRADPENERGAGAADELAQWIDFARPLVKDARARKRGARRLARGNPPVRSMRKVVA